MSAGHRRCHLNALVAGVALLLAAALPASAGASATLGFRDILPVGQGQTVNIAGLASYEATGVPPATFTNQESMFENLLYDGPSLTPADLDSDFKADPNGIGTAGTVSTESPEAGVTVVRDSYNVPHVYATTHAGVMFGAGYVQAEDRLFEMDILRHLGQADLAEFLGPSYLPMDEAVWSESDYDTAELTQQLDDLPKLYGAAGEQALQDEQAYVAGINAYIAMTRIDPAKLPGEYAAIHQTPADWTAADSVAIAAEINQGFDLGGGGQVADAQLLEALQARLGRSQGAKTYADLRALDDPAAPTTTTKRFPFDNPGKVNPASVAMPDPGSVQPLNPVIDATPASAAAMASAGRARSSPATLLGSRLARTGGESFAYLIGAKDSRSGHPIADMGPQLDFFSPELLDEEDLHGPGIDVRGGALPGALPFPIVGHTPKFAWSVTIGVGDHIDTFAERLCNPDGSSPTRQSTDYLYKGHCVPFLVRDRRETTTTNALDTSAPETFVLRTVRSVHGPIQSTGTVHGVPVAFARQDATYGHLADTGLYYDELLTGKVDSPQSFIRTVAATPFSLNWFYIDSKNIAWTLSGTYPIRAKGTSTDFPTWGTGQWDWQGFDATDWTEKTMPLSKLPHQVNPPDGYLANWNNKPAPGWRAASDVFYYSSAHRVTMVSSRINRAIRRYHKLDPTQLTALVEDADTADLRGEEILPLALRVIGHDASAATAPLVKILSQWAATGAHRRDLQKRGYYDDSAAVALMDAWWPRMVQSIFEPVIGSPAYGQATNILAIDDPPNVDAEAYYNGWYGQVAQDLRDVLARRPRRVLGHFSRIYCGGGVEVAGSLARCRAALLSSLVAAAAAVATTQGNPDPSDWRVPTLCPVPDTGLPSCDEIVFSALGAVSTPPIPWQNRPTFQQIVEIG